MKDLFGIFIDFPIDDVQSRVNTAIVKALDPLVGSKHGPHLEGEIKDVTSDAIKRCLSQIVLDSHPSKIMIGPLKIPLDEFISDITIKHIESPAAKILNTEKLKIQKEEEEK